MSAGSIVIDLLMKTGAFETDVKRAEKKLEELKKEATAVGVAIGGAFAGAGIAAAALVKSSIDTMDAMSKLAAQTGTTVEQFSGLAYAADLAGVNQDQLSSALIKLSKNMRDAESGTGSAADGFAALGISVTAADGTLKNSSAMLTELAGKFAAMEDGTQKTALATDIFGKAGAQLIPLLNSGAEGIAELTAEAESLGLVLSTDTAKAAEEFNDNISRLSGAVGGLANRTAAELLPALTEVSVMFVELSKNQAVVQTSSDLVKAAVGGLITIFQTIAVVGSDVGFVFLSVGREIGAWAAQLAALGSGDLKGFTAISDAVKEDGIRARAELDKFQQRIMSIGTANPGAGGSPYKDPRLLGDPGSIASQTAGFSSPRAPGGASRSSSASAKISEFQKYMESLQRQVEKTKELSSVEQVLTDIQAGRLGRVSESQKKQLVALAEEVDLHARLKDQIDFEGEGYKILRAEQEKMSSQAADIFASTRTPLENYQLGLENLDRLHQQGYISIDTYTRATEQLGNAFVQSGEQSKEAADEMTEFAKQAERNIQDALGNTLEQSLKGNFDSIGDMWKDLLTKMAAQALAAQLNQALFGGGGGGGGIGSFIGSLFSAASGGVGSPGNAGFGNYADPSFFSTPMATGTNYVPYDGFKATLHEGEAVVPKKYNPAAGGQAKTGVTIDMSGAVYNVGSNVSKAEVIDAVRTGNAYVEAKIRRSLAQERAY